ncbi:hypothetical protein B9Z55_026910 [Caenorhabditis nigoni]|uniref:F-box domain-containing protein n=1 Tax=Caenorhabditis nigoni TaxID=1611254 RepID=A0A2G5SHU7_9PELO|nr:hypothetical protein B9Z55_026910 [Caenorhabditis nigoni]
MDESSAVIKSNDHHLKTCILNEVRKKKPIFNSYRNFCETVGQDAMEYPDFEFWYYRFYHGQRDFGYDRSMDPVPKTIMDMPVSLMYKITENLDTVERTNLRSMNKSIKEVAENHESIFDKVEITVSGFYLNWKFDSKSFDFIQDNQGCTVYTPNTSQFRSHKNFIKKGLEYLIPFFKIPKIRVNHLSVSMMNQASALDHLLPVPFHARSVSFFAADNNKVIPFLSAFIPGQLESIELKSLHSSHEEIMLKFFETEQFKQAKHVKLRGYFKEDDLWNFSNLESFECELDPNEPVDFQKIKEILPTFPQLESCKLKRHNHRSFLPLETFAEALGEQIPFGSLNTITHRYQIPKSNECLEFTVKNKGSYCSIKIVKIR